MIRPLLHALDVSEFKLTEIRCQGFVGINVFSADFDISFYIESKKWDMHEVYVGWGFRLFCKETRKDVRKLVPIRYFEFGDIKRVLRYMSPNIAVAATKRYLPQVQDEIIEEIKKLKC